MSFDKEIDKQFDQIGQSIEKGTSSLFTNVIGPFFYSVGTGTNEVMKKGIWKTRSFQIGILVLLVVGVVAGWLENTYFPDLYAKNPFWHWLYHRQKLLPYPFTIILLLGFILSYFNGHGKEVAKLRKEFMIAFERCGLYSRRRVIKEDKPTPEYPSLHKELLEQDGGISYVFKNVGIPLGEWEKSQSSLEASINKKISSITMYYNSPAYILIKIGGAEIPLEVEFNETLLKHADSKSIVVGAAKTGYVTHDFKVNPHLLIGGSTGAGKTVVATSVVYQCIAQLKGILFIIDFKKGPDYVDFEDMGIEIIYDRTVVVKLLHRMIPEHEERMKLFKQHRVRNIDEYNQKFPKTPLRRVFILVDELAELNDKKSCAKDEKDLVDMTIGGTSSIARLCRASGIHLVLATQRPDADVVPGQIKDNVTGRLCGYFKSDIGYRIVLDHLPHPRIPSPKDWPGRFIYSVGTEDYHIQTPYFQEHHVDKSIRMEYESGVLTLQNVMQEITTETDEFSPIASQRLREFNIEDIE